MSSLQKNLRKFVWLGEVCLDGVCVDSRKFVAAVKDSQMEVSVGTLKCKRLHGQFYSLLDGEGVDKRLSVEWLRDGRLKSESEGLLVAAQDGVVRTRVYAVKIMGISGPVKCRMCGVSEETVSHVLCCCGKWSWTLYKDRHDHALRPLFVFLCNYFNLRPSQSVWHMLKSGADIPAVVENEEVKLCWDVCLPTEARLRKRRPDMLLYLKKEKLLYFIEMAVALDVLVAVREREVSSYQELEADVAKQMKGWRVKTVAVVVGALGVVCNLKTNFKLLGFLGEKELVHLCREIQMEALVGSVRVLRRHLTMRG